MVDDITAALHSDAGKVCSERKPRCIGNNCFAEAIGPDNRGEAFVKRPYEGLALKRFESWMHNAFIDARPHTTNQIQTIQST